MRCDIPNVVPSKNYKCFKNLKILNHPLVRINSAISVLSVLFNIF